MNHCAPEVITRQLAWLPLRHSTRNRLGLLRRAIEEDWPKPEGHGDDEGQQRGRLFASHYYAAYHGYEGEAKTEAFPKDTLSAAQFVERLLALRNEPKLVPEWGRQFGGFIRRQHQADSKARPNLAPAIVLHGDEFLRRLDSNRTASVRTGRHKAEAARHAALWPEYLGLPWPGGNRGTAGRPGPLRGFPRATRTHTADHDWRVVPRIRRNADPLRQQRKSPPGTGGILLQPRKLTAPRLRLLV